MATKMFQNVIMQLSGIIERTVGILDENGMVIACGDMGKVGDYHDGVIDEIESISNVFFYGGFTYLPIGGHTKTEHVAFVSGEDAESEKLVRILSVSMTNIKNLYNDKYDKSFFVKNIILDNILPGDIYIKSKDLMFSNDTERIVYLIKFSSMPEPLPYEIIRNMFPDKDKDFVISLGETDVALVKDLSQTPGVKPDENDKDIEKEDAEDKQDVGNIHEYTAKAIVDTISSEFYTKAVVGVGSVVNNIKHLSRSFKEAMVAVEVGKVFENDKYVMNYDKLGIGRLIYQLPTTMCEKFLEEVFKLGEFESLDREALATIQRFFENSLNVSETARKLFIHRNTLVYRIEKIKRLTGLDLREFENAVTFKVAMMVKKYLSAKPVKY